jgi:ribonucleoside-diphosphate reductase alpha chain
MSDALASSPIYQSLPPISRKVWDDKYRLKKPDGTPIDKTPEATLHRVADFLATAEGSGNSSETLSSREYWARKFYSVMETFEFMPAGRIIAGAGAGRNVTLSNCFVMGTIPDSMVGIFDHLKQAAVTMQAGGGIGYDFSPIRPKGAHVAGVAADASGPLSFMDCWDAMCRTVMSAGSRRGAMMATMICDHPDIEDFIKAKHDPARLRNFNLSVMVTDAFMAAVKADADWPLVHKKPPVKRPPGSLASIMRPSIPHRPNSPMEEVFVHRTVKARYLWDLITRNTYDHAEPGIMFIDRVNRQHNLWDIDFIRASNPCGEKFMGPYDSCLLGSLNLAMLVKDAFTPTARLDRERLREVVKIAIRMMDNVIDVNYFPLPEQAEKARETRQLGLGITGLADMLAMLGITYGTAEAALFAEGVMREITEAAYWASVDLASEKGSFPAFDKVHFLGGQNFAATQLDEDLKTAIEELGIRNSLLTSIAPTGTISLFMKNVSSGMEPIFAYSYTRKVLQPDGSKAEERVEDYAVKLYRDRWEAAEFANEVDPETFNTDHLPGYFVTAQTLTPSDHVRMQGALQKWVDSSISKTINCPEDISFEDFQSVYMEAWEAGCKGCTTYRPNDVTGSVLSVTSAPEKPAEAPSRASALPAAEDRPSTRPEVLDGKTYKIKIGSMDHAVYVTVTHTPGYSVTGYDSVRPFEVFISTKDPSHQVWMTALSRMISAIFRRPHDSSFVPEELKAVFDPTFTGFHGGRQVPSVVAAIGDVIERHMRSIGYIQPGTHWKLSATPKDVKTEEVSLVAPLSTTDKTGSRICPKCFSANLKNEAGCYQCLDCGNSKCG